LNLKIIFLLLAASYAGAQTTCPPINFLNAKTVNLDVTDSSHLTLLRQSDGSYTAFEMANTSPYAILRSIPHFEQQFSNCLPRPTSHASGKAAPPASSQSGVAQSTVFAVLQSGNYLFVSPSDQGPSSLDVAVFDQHLQLVSQNEIGALANGPAPGFYSDYVALILTDVNGDGKLDLIAEYEQLFMGAEGNGGGVNVFLGDGLGGFHAAGRLALSGVINGSMAVGDINGDGKPDIAVGAPGVPGGIVIALGKGDGTFVTSTLPTPNLVGPAAIAIADLNGDGKQDLVFLTGPAAGVTAASLYAPASEVAVMLGTGGGAFSPPAVFPVAGVYNALGGFNIPGPLAVGDMNGDGVPDIVTNGITILLGDGQGGFPTRKDFLNTNNNPVILADFDRDGKMDVVIGVGSPLVLSREYPTGPGLPNTEDELTVFFGDGAGGLTAAPLASPPIQATLRSLPFNLPYGAQNPWIALTSGDFNKDGIADLAVVSGFQFLSVFLSSASDAITPTFAYDFTVTDHPEAYPTSVVTADFNQDGIPDLAVAVARPTGPGSIMIFLGKGDGTFLAPLSTNAPGSIWSLVTGDFNKDGHADLAAINTTYNFLTDQVVVFLGQGDGSFASPATYQAGMGAVALVAGDFSQDGFDDIAVGNGTGINLLLGQADGTLSAGTNIAAPAYTVPVSLAVGDLNGDGKLDLVAEFYTQGIAFLYGNGDGTFLAPELQPFGSAFVAVGDINGDGIPDLFLSGGSVLIGNGNGTFQLQTSDLPDLGGPVIAADFNGDGKLDVASGLSFPSQGAAVFFNLSHPSSLLTLVSAADFSFGPMAPHSIASAFGKHLALSTASATLPSLPTTLGGASVSVQDQSGTVSQAEIYYASPGQVNFVLPQGLELGSAIVTITTTDGQSSSAEIQIVPLAPKIFLVDPSGIPAGYVVRVGADNVQTVEPIFTEQGGSVQEVPIDLSSGDVYLILFGTGFDVLPNGVGAQIEYKDLTLVPTFAGPQTQFPGLDQIDILLPKSLAGNGRTDITLLFQPMVSFYITIK
jgi:uncharacterized protein (TIGR03437 family)